MANGPRNVFLCTVLFLTFLQPYVSEGQYAENEVAETETKLSYLSDSESQMLPCKFWGDCGKNGMCVLDEPDKYGLTFCSCHWGASGDRCEIIDQCHSKEVDCGGVDSNATCTLGGKGKAYCKCQDAQQGFDYDNKKCRDCECGSAFSCAWKGGNKSCTCSKWAEYFDGEKCVDCECGDKIRCSLVEGKKVCDCNGGFKQQEKRCQYCSCGSHGSNCRFEGMKKQCDCEPHYAMGPDDKCVEVCNSTHPCQNGGTCDGVCRCPKGVSGNFCQSVDWCAFRCRNPELEECVWDPVSEKGECRCKLPHYLYDLFEDKCIECDCGVHANCSIGYNGRKNCKCEEGYDERKGKCEECDCGHGSCSFEYYSGTKRCYCDKNYRPLEIEGEERCTLCDCGRFATSCRFGVDKKKVCVCQSGYASLMGKCKSCDCRLDVLCNYGDGWNGKKFCDCPKGYMFNGEFCEDIDECEERTAVCYRNMECVNTPGSYECECKVGFKRLWDDDDRYGCQDIDECMQPDACEYTSTFCRNTIGSYSCVCNFGFLPGTDYETGRYSTRHNWCYSPVSPWRSASIIVGSIFGVIIVLLIVVIIVRRYRASNR